MKRMIASFVLVVSITAIASLQREASPKEIASMCAAIDRALEEEAADMALDSALCLKTKMFVTGMELGGTEISGRIPFRFPNRPASKQNCSAKFNGNSVNYKTVSCR